MAPVLVVNRALAAAPTKVPADAVPMKTAAAAAPTNVTPRKAAATASNAAAASLMLPVVHSSTRELSLVTGEVAAAPIGTALSADALDRNSVTAGRSTKSATLISIAGVASARSGARFSAAGAASGAC